MEGYSPIMESCIVPRVYKYNVQLSWLNENANTFVGNVRCVDVYHLLCPPAGVAASTLHPLDWKTGLLWESLWGESVRTTRCLFWEGLQSKPYPI